MYSFTPNGRRRGLHAVVIVDLTASVLLWTSATAGGSYGWIFQLAGVVLAVLGIYLITRYSLRSYTFSVQDSELVDSAGNPVYDLVITQTLGRKISVVARVSLRDIRHLTVLSRPDFRKCRKKKYHSLTLFRYDSDPFAPLAAYLPVPDEHALLAIPPTPPCWISCTVWASILTAGDTKDAKDAKDAVGKLLERSFPTPLQELSNRDEG